MTPFDWTRGRLFAIAASLFVLISGQVLKWQEPSSAMAGRYRGCFGFAGGRKKSILPEKLCKRTSANQHAVPITVKAVASLHGMDVGSEHIFASSKGAHQRQQCRAGKMEVCQQRVHYAK